MRPDFCVGIDVGTGSLKGVAVALDGRLREEATVAYPLAAAAGGRREQDPELWWQACREVMDRLDARHASGIGLSGQMHGLVLLDGRHRVLRPAILWNDARASREATDLEQRVGGAAASMAIAGSRPMAGLTAPKLLWMRRHEPDVLARARHLLLPKDEVRRRLCGELATDFGDASGTWLFDVRSRAWSPQLADAAETDIGLLSLAADSQTLAGRTRAGVPVAMGSGDQACGAVGVGAVREGIISLVLGTSGVVLLPRPSPEPDPRIDTWTHTFCHAVPDWWYTMGVSLSAGGSLAWLRAVIGTQVEVPVLFAEAEGWGPGCEGLNFLPYLSGERTPIGRADARGAFVGLGLEHDRGALVRAVLEGVAYAIKDCLDAVLANAAADPVEIRLSGGGAQGELWVRILASVLQRPLSVVTRTAGAAYGAALLGGVAAGVWKSCEDAPADWHGARRVQPEDRWAEAYEAGAARQRQLREQLIPG